MVVSLTCRCRARKQEGRPEQRRIHEERHGAGRRELPHPEDRKRQHRRGRTVLTVDVIVADVDAKGADDTVSQARAAGRQAALFIQTSAPGG
jgi:hypothetical protein